MKPFVDPMAPRDAARYEAVVHDAGRASSSAPATKEQRAARWAAVKQEIDASKKEVTDQVAAARRQVREVRATMAAMGNAMHELEARRLRSRFRAAGRGRAWPVPTTLSPSYVPFGRLGWQQGPTQTRPTYGL